MSTSNLFNPECDFNLFCNEMKCKKIIPQSEGNVGDIMTTDVSGNTIFSKTFEGSDEPYTFKNCSLEVLNSDNNIPAVLGVGVQTANTQPAVLGIGEKDTQSSFIFYYDPTSKNLGMLQNNACVDKDFDIHLNNGNFILNNKLKLPTVAANSFLKLDNSNVVSSANSSDFENVYNIDGIVTNGENRKILLGTGSSIQIGPMGIFGYGLYIDDTGVITLLSGTIILPNQLNGYLKTDNAGIIYVENGENTYSSPGNYSLVVPANFTKATVTAVGGGGGGWTNAGFAAPGGGGGGSIVDFPISVTTGQTINITVGQGGASNNDGTDTIINVGTLVITCGKGFTSTDSILGGNGGSVNYTFGSTTGGLGGAFQVVGDNGNMNFFVYSGAGGGGTRANGGNVLLFSGGLADSNYAGGGATAFANGADFTQNGSLGSGGGANGGSGGNGFVKIIFYN